MSAPKIMINKISNKINKNKLWYKSILISILVILLLSTTVSIKAYYSGLISYMSVGDESGANLLVGTGISELIVGDAIPIPAVPTNVSATDGTYTNKITITWTKSTDATGYKLYRDGTLFDTVGDVATDDDTGAAVPTITPGTANATDGSSTSYSTLSLTGASANHGAASSYTVKAIINAGDSAASTADTGYIGIGTLTHQWQRSDTGVSYSDLSGATTNPYNDTTGTAGTTYYYRCTLSATGASNQNSSADTGYKAVTNTTPAIVTTTSVTNITYNSGTSGGNITNVGSSNVTERGICYGTSAYPTTSGNKISEIVGAPYGIGAYTDIMSGLNAATSYHVRAYAINGVGTSYGEDQIFTTLISPSTFSLSPAGVLAQIIPVLAVVIIILLVIAALTGTISLPIVILLVISILIGLAFLAPIVIGLGGI